jgi:serine/threonine-protein kinase OSR1/STK39
MDDTEKMTDEKQGESDYELLEQIGVGSSCVVHRGKHKKTGREVAIKIIKLDDAKTDIDTVYKEIVTLKQLKHDNIIEILESFVIDQDIWMIMELQSNSCNEILKKGFGNGIKDEVLIATILKYTLQAIEYCHSQNKIHRDIKGGNILISNDGHVKLTDFGVSATLLHDGGVDKMRYTFTGTPCWMAPEIFEQNGYDSKVDIWSLGIVALELAFGSAPYAHHTPMKVLMLIINEKSPDASLYNDNSYTFSKYFHKFVAECLEKDPLKRPSASKLLKHKFLRQAKDEKYIKDHLFNK